MTEFKRRRTKKKQRGEHILEKDVKEMIDTEIKLHSPYICNPATHGYGKSGHPDKISCVYGRFVGIEAKQGNKDWSKYQKARLEEIQDAGGLPLFINEHKIPALRMHLRILKQLHEGELTMDGLPSKYLKVAGPVFKRVRENRGIDLKQASEMAGMHRQTLRRYEEGQSPMPASVLFALLEIYDADMGKVGPAVRAVAEQRGETAGRTTRRGGEEE